MSDDDKSLEYLLDLDGEIMIINEKMGLWVKFEARRITATDDRPHGVKYSLSLHDRNNHRILGFDNAHMIEHGGKRKVAPQKTYYHWHRNQKDQGTPYHYTNAAALMEDFWKEVDRVVNVLEEPSK